MKPLVSYLIPAYNRSEYIEEAIKSCLNQNYENIEVIISDNSEGDTIQKIATRYSKVKYFKNENNIGPILNWKKAISLSEGKYLVILSDDDYFINPNYTEFSVNLLEKNLNINLVICDCIIGKTEQKITKLELPLIVSGDIFFQNFWEKNYQIPVISNFFRKESLEKINFFEKNTILYSDIELWLKLMKKGDIGYCNLPSVYYRFHENNIVDKMSVENLITNIEFIKNISEDLEDKKSYRKKMLHKYIIFIAKIYKLNLKQIKNIYEHGGNILGIKCDYKIFILKTIINEKREGFKNWIKKYLV